MIDIGSNIKHVSVNDVLSIVALLLLLLLLSNAYSKRMNF